MARVASVDLTTIPYNTTMHIIPILFCLTGVILFNCDTLCFDLHSFIDKTLQICQRSSNGHYEQHKFQHEMFPDVGGGNSPNQKRKPLGSKVGTSEIWSYEDSRLSDFLPSLVDWMRSHLICVASHWEVCRKQHFIAIPYMRYTASITYRPYAILVVSIPLTWTTK